MPGMLDYIRDFAEALKRANEEPDLTWEAELRAQNALPFRERLRQLFTIPPPGPRPMMVPPAMSPPPAPGMLYQRPEAVVSPPYSLGGDGDYLPVGMFSGLRRR